MNLMQEVRRVRIVGAGLIGTSIGLALSGKGVAVEMADSDQKNEALAQDLVGALPEGEIDLVIFALPTSRLSLVISDEFALNPKAAFMDIGSIKAKPLLQVESVAGLPLRFVGSHPMAGREIGGPESARADLFAGRPWIYTPTSATEADVIDLALTLITTLGGTPIMMSAEDHDAAVALISHLPQLSSSLLASQLRGASEGWLALAGQGLKDSTRIAASAPSLWREIISSNREEILPLLKGLSSDLLELIEHFDDDEFIESTIKKGREGRGEIPGKHGGRNRDYIYLPIVIEDKPGQLALLFQECADANVNVEDLSIEHSPGQFTGLITLAVSHQDSLALSEHLRARGWKVHGK